MCVWETRQNEFKLREKCKQSESASLALKSTLCSPESSLTVCQTVSWPFAPQIGHGISNTVNTSLSLRFQQKKNWQIKIAEPWQTGYILILSFFFFFFFAYFFFLRGHHSYWKLNCVLFHRSFWLIVKLFFLLFPKLTKKEKNLRTVFFSFSAKLLFFLYRIVYLKP